MTEADRTNMANNNDLLRQLGLLDEEDEVQTPLRPLDQLEPAPIPEIAGPQAPEILGEEFGPQAPPIAAPSGEQRAASPQQDLLQQYKSLIPKALVQDPKELASAQGRQSDQLRLLGMLQGSNQVAQALAAGSGGKIGTPDLGHLRESAGLDVKNIQSKQKLERENKRQEILNHYKALSEGRAQRKESSDSKIQGLKLQDAESLSDSDSPISKVLRKYMEAKNPEYTKDLEGAPASQLMPVAKLLGKTDEINASTKARLEQRELSRKDRAERHRERLDFRQEQKLDKDVEVISKRLEKTGVLQQRRAFDDIEGYLAERGADLDHPDSAPEIPGMGLLGGFRPDVLTPTADVSFRQNVQALANRLLKARSGAAVTDTEYRRFLMEAGSGDFSSEQNLMTGLKKMRDDIKLQSTNILKSADPDAAREYEHRTGVNLSEFIDSYNPRAEKKIADFMEKNKISDRNKAIEVLKDNGYL